jgi:3-carboxy-cis,cis-muconate cycloisomerase
VRPSSSPSDAVWSGVFARGGAAEAVTARSWLQAMLDVEAGLARACAAVGLVPEAAADAIGAACDADRFDAGALGTEAAGGGNPVIPLVAALRAAVGSEAAPHVHRGATSQDVIDTAMMLVARRALIPLLRDASDAVGECAALAQGHRDTAMVGRTLLQQAQGVTFGLVAAHWLLAIDEARALVARAADETLAVQLGGPVGTLAGYDGQGLEVARRLALDLELLEPVAPWHTNRVRPAALAGALGVLAGAVAKVGRDVTLLAQDEVGEVREREAGGSSSMGHKQNPVAAIATVGCAQRVPALVATLQGAMAQEHQRAAGLWHAEWEAWSDLLRLTGGAVGWAATSLVRLEVDTGRMRLNLDEAVERHGLLPDPGEASALVDRALATHDAGGEA